MKNFCKESYCYCRVENNNVHVLLEFLNIYSTIQMSRFSADNQPVQGIRGIMSPLNLV